MSIGKAWHFILPFLTLYSPLQIIKIEEWKEECGLPEKLIKKPTPNIHERIGFTKRIGSMMPEKKDNWWTYGLDTNELTLLDEVTGMIKNTFYLKSKKPKQTSPTKRFRQRAQAPVV